MDGSYDPFMLFLILLPLIEVVGGSEEAGAGAGADESEVLSSALMVWINWKSLRRSSILVTPRTL